MIYGLYTCDNNDFDSGIKRRRHASCRLSNSIFFVLLSAQLKILRSFRSHPRLITTDLTMVKLTAILSLFAVAATASGAAIVPLASRSSEVGAVAKRDIYYGDGKCRPSIRSSENINCAVGTYYSPSVGYGACGWLNVSLSKQLCILS